ncbi:MAG: arsenate reductase ArsC [Bacteroidota bacterium]
MNEKVLIISEKNSCRSQIAEAILKSLDNHLLVYSAGISSSPKINPLVVLVMDELGIDVRNYYSKSVSEFFDQQFDHVITLSDNAKVECINLITKAKEFHHYQIDHPAQRIVLDEEIMDKYRRIRDKIFSNVLDFYLTLRKN